MSRPITDAELAALDAAVGRMTPPGWVAFLADATFDEPWGRREAVISHKANGSGTRLGRMVLWPGDIGNEDAAGIVALRNSYAALRGRLRVAEAERDAERDAEREACAESTPPPCPSCNGTGWVVIIADRITIAGGPCRCVGGLNWHNPPSETHP